eukprot:CAMPEP_0175045136 /NCGR_PEP_ID=MMETSP0052_2-20121109/4226_1 /TAXON_ID=51329 ORGANISM="Polytomella parva, Strain SAG 63-3" /NCGR_SAMPLE_ID=MMETSP0052_2 /ASSEMBLY_ACC=CAM_ASM_000194 /LENGTH=535 /DNA_ID=CAMNT_0016308575 /DNA_START=356 /DNA_END=1963 /DNA_ORIENTATION=+
MNKGINKNKGVVVGFFDGKAYVLSPLTTREYSATGHHLRLIGTYLFVLLDLEQTFGKLIPNIVFVLATGDLPTVFLPQYDKPSRIATAVDWSLQPTFDDNNGIDFNVSKNKSHTSSMESAMNSTRKKNVSNILRTSTVNPSPPGHVIPPIFRFATTLDHADIPIPYTHFYTKFYDSEFLNPKRLRDMDLKHPWEMKEDVIFGRFSLYKRFIWTHSHVTRRFGAEGANICDVSLPRGSNWTNPHASNELNLSDPTTVKSPMIKRSDGSLNESTDSSFVHPVSHPNPNPYDNLPHVTGCEVRAHFLKWARGRMARVSSNEKSRSLRQLLSSQSSPTPASSSSSSFAKPQRQSRVRIQIQVPIDASHTHFIKMADHAQFRYLVHLDGQGPSSRLEQLLPLQSVVLREMSGYDTFFTHLLQPYKHYVPFWRERPEEIINAVQWCRNSDSPSSSMDSDPEQDRARQVAAAGRAFAREFLSGPKRQCFWFRTFKEYRKQFRNYVPKLSEWPKAQSIEYVLLEHFYRASEAPWKNALIHLEI